jgi:hypothetical protein
VTLDNAEIRGVRVAGDDFSMDVPDGCQRRRMCCEFLFEPFEDVWLALAFDDHAVAFIAHQATQSQSTCNTIDKRPKPHPLHLARDQPAPSAKLRSDLAEEHETTRL